MKYVSVVCALCVLVALTNGAPMPQNDQDNRLDTRSQTRRIANEINDRIKMLRLYCPQLFQVIDNVIQNVTSTAFRVIGRVVLQSGALGIGGGGGGGGSGASDAGGGAGGSSAGGSQVSVVLPTFGPDEEDYDEDVEEVLNNVAASSPSTPASSTSTTTTTTTTPRTSKPSLPAAAAAADEAAKADFGISIEDMRNLAADGAVDDTSGTPPYSVAVQPQNGKPSSTGLRPSTISTPQISISSAAAGADEADKSDFDIHIKDMGNLAGNGVAGVQPQKPSEYSPPTGLLTPSDQAADADFKISVQDMRNLVTSGAVDGTSGSPPYSVRIHPQNGKPADYPPSISSAAAAADEADKADFDIHIKDMGNLAGNGAAAVQPQKPSEYSPPTGPRTPSNQTVDADFGIVIQDMGNLAADGAAGNVPGTPPHTIRVKPQTGKHSEYSPPTGLRTSTISTPQISISSAAATADEADKSDFDIHIKDMGNLAGNGAAAVQPQKPSEYSPPTGPRTPSNQTTDADFGIRIQDMGNLAADDAAGNVPGTPPHTISTPSVSKPSPAAETAVADMAGNADFDISIKDMGNLAAVDDNIPGTSPSLRISPRSGKPSDYSSSIAPRTKSPASETRAKRETAERTIRAAEDANANDQESAASGGNALNPSDDLSNVEADDADRDKRFLPFGGSFGASASGGSAGGSGNFLFDIIRSTADGAARAAGTVYRMIAGTENLGLGFTATASSARTFLPQLVSGSGATEESDEKENAPGGVVEVDVSKGTSPEGIPGPITRMFVLANRGIANLIQDLILRIAATSERIVNFKARLITALI